MQEYKTMFHEAVGELTEKKSRFIAHIRHIESPDDATAFLNDIRSKYYDARHHVYAYILKDGTKKYSDDGEPQGTSGLPSLNVLEGYGLVDSMVIITRYFGGTLLGTGGLVRAYSGAVKNAVENGEIVTMCKCVCVRVSCDYSQWDRVKKFTEDFGATVDSVEFSSRVDAEISFRAELLDNYKNQFIELTDGKGISAVTGEKFTGVKNL